MHGVVPATLQEAKPKAGSIRWPTVSRRVGPQTGVKPRSRSQIVPERLAFFRSTYLSEGELLTPTKINRGGRLGTNGTWARTGRNVGPPVRGSKPAKG
jgi:hypothetical protein